MELQKTAAVTLLVIVLGAPTLVCGKTSVTTSNEKQRTTDKTPARAKLSDAEKIKQKVAELGIGNRVTVVLRNGNEYYGAITEACGESFEVSEIDLNQKITIAYSEVKKVRSGFGNPNPYNGRRWHPGWHIAALVAVVGTTIALIVAGAAASR